MTAAKLRRLHTKTLRSLVRRVVVARRHHRYVPTDQAMVATYAKQILKQRRL